MESSFKWSNVWLILHREVRDQLRDRRTLFMIAVLPLMLYPFMGMAFMQAAQFLKKQTTSVLVVADAELPASPALLKDGRFADLDESARTMILAEFRKVEIPPDAKARRQASTLIKNGYYDAVLCFPPGFQERFEAARGASDPSAWNGVPQPTIYFNAAKDRSRLTYERLSLLVTQWRERIVSENLQRREVPPEASNPFVLAGTDVSEPVLRRAAMWSKILPFVVIVWALTGAFYPAIDLCAGEKERGTLETLLCSPAHRMEIVCGKLLTVMIFSMTTSILNVLCMTFTASFVLAQFQSLPTAAPMMLGPPPFQSFAWLLLALVPISALFSALALALAAMAKSTREGQYYLMPLLMATMPLTILPMLPSVDLDLGTSLLPVAGVLLLLRQLMEGEYRQALLYAAPVIAVTGGCCLLAMRWAVDQFNNEAVLFREGERLDLMRWLKYALRERAPTPSAGQAVMCGILILLVRFFAGLTLPMPETWGDFVMSTSVTLIAFVATPALLMAIVLTTCPKETLLLRWPKVISIAIAALLAVSLHPLAVALTAVIGRLYPIDSAGLAHFGELMHGAPSLTSLLLVMALMPAICEEIAFRGFILSGFRHLGHKWRAILFASIFFGLAHGILQQSLVAGIFGLALGYIAVQTQSIIPCIVFHAVHNGLGILASQYLPWLAEHCSHLRWLIVQLPGPELSAQPTLVHGPAVILVTLLFAAILLRWCANMPFYPTEEERLCEALDHERGMAPSL